MSDVFGIRIRGRGVRWGQRARQRRLARDYRLYGAPSLELHRRVKAGFVLQGSSLGAWCRKHGVSEAAAKQALVGVWNGTKGQAMRRRIVDAARLGRLVQVIGL